MSAYRIPLTAVPQSLSVNLAGTEYQLTLRWNDADEGGWFLDIDLPDDGGAVVHGIPLVTGADLLEPYAYLGIGGGLVVWADSHDDPPAQGELGDGVNLYFVTEDAQ